MKNDNMKNLTANNVVSQMKLGWSLGNTMDAINSSIPVNSNPEKWETAWFNPVTSKSLIETVIDKGFNVIRIPVSWNDHIVHENNHQIVDSWMDRVQEIVDFAYNHGAYVILNIHHESWHMPYYDNEEKASEILCAVWTQIAHRFKDYDEHLIFEGMNEPRKVGTDVEWNGGDSEGWDMVNRLNRVFVDTIRNSIGNNPDRILMIPGYAANCWEAVKHIEVPQNDKKIAVSVHAYEPYDFALSISGPGVWNEDTRTVDKIFDSLDKLFISKGIPVIIGEFGAMYKPVEGNEKERAAWAQYYVSKAKSVGIPCVWWDNGLFTGEGELFGLIDRETLDWKYPLVVDGVLRGL